MVPKRRTAEATNTEAIRPQGVGFPIRGTRGEVREAGEPLLRMAGPEGQAPREIVRSR